MITLLAGWLAKSALMQSPIGGFLKAIPRPVWIALAIVAAGLMAYAWHGRTARKALGEAYQAGVAHERAEGVRQALQWKGRIDRLTASISTKHREKSDEENRAIARAADDQRVRGPGRAVCPGPAVIPGAAGRPVAGGRPADAAVAGLPEPVGNDIIAMPFAPTVDFAEQHDGFRSEALSWRGWYADLVDTWAKLTAAQPAAAAPAK